MIIVTPSSATKKILSMVSSVEWQERAKGVTGYIPYIAARDVREGLVARIPNDEEWGRYRDSLEVSWVVGRPIYAIRASWKQRRLKKTNVGGQIIYVRPKRRLVRMAPAAAVLADFNPWTWDTLPHTPSKRFATLVVRKVKNSTVEEVRTMRDNDEKQWRKRLLSAGVRLRSSARQRRERVDPKAEAVADVAHAAVKLEFGIGTRAKAHWRPALRELATSGLKRISRRKELKYALMRPDYESWRKWPPKLSSTISLAAVRKYTAFQKRLGIRLAK